MEGNGNNKIVNNNSENKGNNLYRPGQYSNIDRMSDLNFKIVQDGKSVNAFGHKMEFFNQKKAKYPVAYNIFISNVNFDQSQDLSSNTVVKRIDGDTLNGTWDKRPTGIINIFNPVKQKKGSSDVIKEGSFYVKVNEELGTLECKSMKLNPDFRIKSVNVPVENFGIMYNDHREYNIISLDNNVEYARDDKGLITSAEEKISYNIKLKPMKEQEEKTQKEKTQEDTRKKIGSMLAKIVNTISRKYPDLDARRESLRLSFYKDNDLACVYIPRKNLLCMFGEKEGIISSFPLPEPSLSGSYDVHFGKKLVYINDSGLAYIKEHGSCAEENIKVFSVEQKDLFKLKGEINSNGNFNTNHDKPVSSLERIFRTNNGQFVVEPYSSFDRKLKNFFDMEIANQIANNNQQQNNINNNNNNNQITTTVNTNLNKGRKGLEKK